MKLFSTDFEDGGELPEKFTCNGEGAKPSFAWSEIPEGTKSLAISLVDPDAPGGNFVHWILVDIPPETLQLSGNELIGRELKNTTGENNYVPPCPPSGKHRYVFTLYALDIGQIEKEADDNFFSVVKKHTIELKEITAIYGKL
ncbi:MAG: YbhB/YbcL family Raf kinase inhibitor-like protein [Patescibacteria group bacterium]|jgi:hypothetical protein